MVTLNNLSQSLRSTARTLASCHTCFSSHTTCWLHTTSGLSTLSFDWLGTGSKLPVQPHQWHHILQFTHKSSICMRIQETNFKMRWYPSQLQEFFPSTSDLCCRCQKDRGTRLYIFWSCPKIADFWKTVHQIIQKFMECPLSQTSRPSFSIVPPLLQRKSIRNPWSTTSLTLPKHISAAIGKSWGSLHPDTDRTNTPKLGLYGYLFVFSEEGQALLRNDSAD